MNGEQYVQELIKLQKGLAELQTKFDEAASTSDPAWHWSGQREAWQKALNRMAELTRRFDTIPTTDPWYFKAVNWKADILSNERFASVNRFLGVTIDAWGAKNKANNAFWPSFKRYFVDDIEKVGGQVEKIRDEVIETAQRVAAVAKDWLPKMLPFIIGGVALLLVFRVGAFIPRKK